MASFRALALSAVALVSAGWLQADTLPVDPLIKLKTGGGGGSIDINSTTCAFSGCLVSNPAEVIGANGFADLSVDNQFTTTAHDITAMNIFIPTTNFDQTFTSSAVTLANTPAFQNSFVSTGLFGMLELPGMCSLLTGGIISKTGCIEVEFFSGVSTNLANPCSSSNPLNPCTIPPDAEDIKEGPGNPGFAPGQRVVVQAFFGNATEGFPGLPHNTDSSLALVSDVPEPTTCWLSLSAVAGLLVARCKLRKT